MTIGQIMEVLDRCDFVVNGLGQSEKPSNNQIIAARKEGRLVANQNHVIIVSNEPRENFTCRKTATMK